MQETTLSDHIDTMNHVIARKMHGYKTQTGKNIFDVIVKIFEKHSRVPISNTEKQHIRNVISTAIANETRIPVGCTWGCSGMALSPMKLHDRFNYPRLGDLWGFWWFDILNRKIKHYYEPGIDIVVGDEIPHFHALGWPYKDIIRRHEILKNIVEQHFDFIRVVAIPDYAVTVDEVDMSAPTMDEILAIATSLPGDSIPSSIFDMLYNERNTRNWSLIRKQIPTEVWKEARWVIAKAKKIGRLRKEYGFFDSLFKTPNYIDAAFTEKDRFCPKPWSNTLPQHGASVLSASLETGKYSISIVPEYRLLNRQEYAPTMISAMEFRHFTTHPIQEVSYVFYWTRV